MCFSVFHPSANHSVESLLSDSLVQQLLVSLFTEHLILTAGQAERFWRKRVPTDPELNPKAVKRVLRPLCAAGLVGSEKVILPPVTVRPIPTRAVAWYTDEPPMEWAADAARDRTPDASNYLARTIYFANEPLWPALQSVAREMCTVAAGMRDSSSYRIVESWLLFFSHYAACSRRGDRSIESACSTLTAQYNLNELQFLSGFPPPLDSVQWKCMANRNPNSPLDATIHVAGLGELGVYFLRPLTARELTAQAVAFHDFAKTHDVLTCWWL
jgi:hypothetical protein